jgi:hypothetical protein
LVYTIFINEDGGIEFENGSLKMVGTRDVEDIAELRQSLAMRFLTQLGEDAWHLDEGLDFFGMQMQWIDDPDIHYTQEDTIKVNIIKCIQQDPRFLSVPDLLEVTREDEGHYKVRIRLRTISGLIVDEDIRIGVDFR